MTLFRQIAVHGRRVRVALPVLVALSVFSAVGRAQQSPAIDARRWSVAGTFDVGGIPNDFANQCVYEDNDFTAGGGIAAIFRPRPGLIMSADIRGGFIPYGTGCTLSIPAPIPIGPNEFENWAPRRYPNGVPAEPIVRTALHVGLETPSDYPLLRAMVGAGVIWTGGQAPFGSLAVGGGSRRRGVRFSWEIETSLSRVLVHENHSRYRLDAGGVQTPLAPRVASYVIYPRWTAVHLGLEVPIR